MTLAVQPQQFISLHFFSVLHRMKNAFTKWKKYSRASSSTGIASEKSDSHMNETLSFFQFQLLLIANASSMCEKKMKNAQCQKPYLLHEVVEAKTKAEQRNYVRCEKGTYYSNS